MVAGVWVVVKKRRRKDVVAGGGGRLLGSLRRVMRMDAVVWRGVSGGYYMCVWVWSSGAIGWVIAR